MNVYALACPTTVPPPSPFNCVFKVIISCSFGAPATLLTLKRCPISKGTLILDIFSVSLGFSTSEVTAASS